MIKLMAAAGTLIAGFLLFPSIRTMINTLYNDMILVNFPDLSNMEKAWFTALPFIVLVSIFVWAAYELFKGRRRKEEE